MLEQALPGTSAGKRSKSAHHIQLRLRDLAQLFNSLDPTPFHHRDLDPDAEEFIESWALEFPGRGEFAISISLEKFPETDPTAATAEAIHNYFDYKAELTRRELRQLMQRGRTSLIIGLGFLALLVVVTDIVGKFPVGPIADVMRESLTIGGWVAMWRPLQIFLYDWWPITHRRRIYRSLSRAEITVRPHGVAR